MTLSYVSRNFMKCKRTNSVLQDVRRTLVCHSNDEEMLNLEFTRGQHSNDLCVVSKWDTIAEFENASSALSFIAESRENHELRE